VSTQSPRVLFVVPSSAIGGVETLTRTLMNGFGLPVAVLTYSRFSAAYAPHPTFSFDTFGCGQLRYESPASLWCHIRAIRHAVRAHGANIIIGMMETGSLISVLARDLFHLRCPVITTVHGNISSYLRFSGRPLAWWERALLRYLFRRSVATLTPSVGVAEDLVAHHGAPAGRCRAIHNGIDLAAVAAAAHRPIPLEKHGPWLVTASRLGPERDFATLLRAFAELHRHHPTARWLVLGEGAERERIVTMAEQAGVADAITLTGFLADPHPIIARADIFIFASFLEGFGNVLVEAMAAGVPVVVTDTPSGPAEIVEEGVSGHLVAMGDWQALAGHCQRLLDNPAQRAAMGVAARQRAALFSADRMIAGYRQVVDDALA